MKLGVEKSPQLDENACDYYVTRHKQNGSESAI